MEWRVFETGALRAAEAGHHIALDSNLLNAIAAAIHAVTHRSQDAFITKSDKMAKLLVLAACTSALLQQPARRVSLTPRMGVVKPCVEINQ